MDPLVGAGLAVIGSKDLLNKLLGPTADYVGNEFKSLVEKCNVNLNRVFANAVRKLGPKVDAPGQVNSRVFKEVVDEGRFTEDELAAEYLGGVLASSRTPGGRDDRGVAWVALLRSLSVYQIRFHYVLYRYLREKLLGSSFNIMIDDDCQRARVYMPASAIEQALAIEDDEEHFAILTHCIYGLSKHRLIGETHLFGPADYVNKFYAGSDDEDGAVVLPSPLGAELFLWAHGVPNPMAGDITSSELVLPQVASVGIPETFRFIEKKVAG